MQALWLVEREKTKFPNDENKLGWLRKTDNFSERMHVRECHPFFLGERGLRIFLDVFIDSITWECRNRIVLAPNKKSTRRPKTNTQQKTVTSHSRWAHLFRYQSPYGNAKKVLRGDYTSVGEGVSGGIGKILKWEHKESPLTLSPLMGVNRGIGKVLKWEHKVSVLTLSDGCRQR